MSGTLSHHLAAVCDFSFEDGAGRDCHSVLRHSKTWQHLTSTYRSIIHRTGLPDVARYLVDIDPPSDPARRVRD